MPHVPQDITDTVREMQQQIRDLQGAVNTRPAMNEIRGGNVQVLGGGSFRMMSVDGSRTQMWVGKISPSHPDGSEQRGILMYREDGALAFSLYSADGNPQALALRDKAGTTVVADDVAAGGLARPYLSTDAWFGATESPTFTTNSSAFTTLQNLAWVKQHPKIYAHYLVRADAGVAGQIQLVDDLGTVIAGPVAISAGAWTYGAVAGPLAGALYTPTYLHWQARVTSGTGNIGIRGLSTFGVQS
ncbi:hypothetical protein ACIQF6_14730 [Kitasatospora sp. NPDC092948]|uniref:hypothetical protein n=1 Tax=Kitasatospora sp. NPDC092948 TaxID=3364088 RepID=UPI0037F6F10B